MKQEDLDKYAGNEGFKRAPSGPDVPMLALDGNTGKFHLFVRDGGEGKKQEIDGDVKVVMLRKRRKLFSRDAGLSTREHASLNDIIELWKRVEGQVKSSKIDEGKSSDLKEKYKGDKIALQEIVYSLMLEGDDIANAKMVKLQVKGASFGEPNKDNQHSFYTYLQDLDAKSKRMFSVITELKASKRSGKFNKPYYAIDFHHSKDLNEQQLDVVGGELKGLHGTFTQIDEFYKGVQDRKNNEVKVVEDKQETPKDELPVIVIEEEADSGEIKAEDLPF